MLFPRRSLSFHGAEGGAVWPIVTFVVKDLSKVLDYDWLIQRLCLITLYLFEHAERLNLLLLPPAAPCSQRSFEPGTEILRRRPPPWPQAFSLTLLTPSLVFTIKTVSLFDQECLVS